MKTILKTIGIVLVNLVILFLIFLFFDNIGGLIAGSFLGKFDIKDWLYEFKRDHMLNYLIATSMLSGGLYLTYKITISFITNAIRFFVGIISGCIIIISITLFYWKYVQTYCYGFEWSTIEDAFSTSFGSTISTKIFWIIISSIVFLLGISVSRAEFLIADNDNIKEHPRRFLNNSILLKTYSGIGNGPQICLDFLKTIMNSLEILPSIYALFDYIDLQYRIQIAFTLEPDCQKQYTWMRNKGRIIGNINIMANIIEESVIKKRIEYNDNELSVQNFFDCIIEEKDLELIKKYLPNYERNDCRPIQDTIIYLTTSLRNVLRGHGTFEKEDAYNLYIMIFKLALLNIYLVGTNETVITIDNNPVWMSQDYMYYGVLGSTKFTSSKLLSPFLVASANENILVFNNWNKEGLTELEQIEYINYLEGTLILPEYKSVNIIN